MIPQEKLPLENENSVKTENLHLIETNGANFRQSPKAVNNFRKTSQERESW